MSDENQNDSEVEESSPDEPEKEFKEISELSDKEIQAERKVIISRLLEIQKKFMELEREKGVTEKDIHHNPKGILKEYKEEHEKLANRLVNLAHQIKGSIRT
tara:strand:- start:1192 stop:1497 length:306 start_codon:yes stop_codon:yes gene_type:complete